MASKRLSEASVEKTRATDKRQEIADTIVPGLYLVIQPKPSDGRPVKKSWAVRGRLGGKTIKYTVGDYPAFKLGGVKEDGTARALAQRAIDAIGRGEDPRTIRREERDKTVRAIAALWMEREQKTRRRCAETQRMLDRDVLPSIGHRPIVSIKRRDCVRVIDTVAKRAPVLGNRTRALLHRFFQWCVERDEIGVNPASGIKNPVNPKSIERDRVLSDNELRDVWNAADAIGWPFGPAVKLLILTAGRRTEIGDLQWPEVEDDAITLAGDRTKTGEPRIIPLTDTASKILENLRETHNVEPVDDAPEYVFTTTGRSPASGWSKAKARLDEHCPNVAPWRFHDLRRTAATGLQRLGVRLEVTEAVLGHVSGSRGGIVGVYQRHDYADEKRRALESWSRHVATVLSKKKARKVVALNRG